MEAHQKHYRSKMASKGWLTPAGDLSWPSDEKARREMARGMFGMQLVSTIDYWVMLSLDDVDDTCEAPWAKRERIDAERLARRQVFSQLSEEQKEAFAQTLFAMAKGILHSVCCDLDQFQGGRLQITLTDTPEGSSEPLRIQPGDFLDMHDEQIGWLEDFSMVFGKDAGAEPGATDNLDTAQ